MSHQPVPYYVGAQNDAIYITAGKPPASNNDHPNHDADRVVIAKMLDVDSAEFIVNACNEYAPNLDAIAKAGIRCGQVAKQRDELAEALREAAYSIARTSYVLSFEHEPTRAQVELVFNNVKADRSSDVGKIKMALAKVGAV